MDDPLEGIAHCLRFLHGLTPEEAQEAARAEVLSVLQLESAQEEAPLHAITDADVLMHTRWALFWIFRSFDG
jgi:hypothetical protein